MFKSLFHPERNQVWTVDVIQKDEHAVIVRTFGKRNGKLQTQERCVTSGKNIGKKNETTPFQQACREAESLWKKQQETHGYVIEGEKLAVSAHKPMLAHPFEKYSHKISYPCYVQPKLDGVRMLMYPDGTMLSRTGKPFQQFPHLKNHPTLILDGELYMNNTPFDVISGLCRNKQVTDTTTKLEFHVYDVCDNQSFQERFVQNDFKVTCTSMFKVVTDVCRSYADIEKYHQLYLQKGYEGIMIRNTHGAYEVNKRSYHLQKLKQFQDDEFTIVDVKEGDGVDIDTAILQCVTKEGKTFWVRPTGTREYRSHILYSFNNYKGKLLTVKFQNVTEHGVPRFPVGINIRDYE